MPNDSNVPKTVFVVEDEFYIAETLCDTFEMHDQQVIGPYPDLTRVMRALDERQHADVAVLDVDLKGENVFPLVDRLLRTDTVLVLSTGYDLSSIPDAYAHLPRVMKPVGMVEILGIVNEALAKHRQ